MKKGWQGKSITLTSIFLCLVTLALLEWDGWQPSSSRVDPTLIYIDSDLSDTVDNINDINRVKSGKHITHPTPEFVLLHLFSISPFSSGCYPASSGGIWPAATMARETFDSFCQLVDIPPPSITA